MKQVYELLDAKTKEEIQNEIKSLIIEKAKNQIEDIETYLIDGHSYKCPKCKKLLNKKQNCEVCNQKIDWSKDE